MQSDRQQADIGVDFFEYSNEMLCVADQRGYFLRVNRAWTRTLGWSAEELLSRPYTDFVHPEDIKATFQEAKLLQSEGHETFEFENRYRCRDGSYRWLAWQSTREPKTGLIIAAARDMTAHKTQEEALRLAEERFRVLATQAPVGIYQTDAHGSCVFVNSAWCDIAGATLEDALGDGWIRFIHPADRDMVREKWNVTARTGILFAADYRFQKPSGEVREVIGTAAVMESEQQQKLGFVGTVMDVTQRNVSQRALSFSQFHFRSVLDHLSAFVYVKDLEGRYMLVNRAVEQMLRMSEREVQGKTDLDLYSPEVANAFRQADRTVLEAMRPLDFEHVVPYGDKRYTIRAMKFPLRDHAGEIFAICGITSDVSDLVQANEALQRERELLKNLIDVQEQEKQLLCHEFHDGLIQYAVGAQMLLEGVQHHATGPLAAKLDKAVAGLRRGIEDGRRVIRGIRPSVLDDMGIKAAIEDLIDLYRNTGLSIAFECEVERRLPHNVEVTLYRVVQEALSNARKHSGSQRAAIKLCVDRGELCLEVRDCGRGFNVHEVSKKGFGLVGMTERVRLLNGVCKIESEPNRGTCVRVALPLESQPSGDKA